MQIKKLLKNIVGIDPSVGMMEVGKKKLPEVQFIEALQHLCHLKMRVLI